MFGGFNPPLEKYVCTLLYVTPLLIRIQFCGSVHFTLLCQRRFEAVAGRCWRGILCSVSDVSVVHRKGFQRDPHTLDRQKWLADLLAHNAKIRISKPYLFYC